VANVSDFERYVLPFLDGAPLPAIDDAVVDACVEFATRTSVLTSVSDPITLLANIAEYELDSPDSQTVVTGVKSVQLACGKVDPATRPELDDQYPDGWMSLAVSDLNRLRFYHSRLPGILRLVPMLSVKAANAMTVEVVYAPMRTATQVDDLLFDRYAEMIAQGALARLHQHRASYADPTRVATYLQAFEAAITESADDSPHGFEHHVLRTAAQEPI